jgi:hypothetical protein
MKVLLPFAALFFIAQVPVHGAAVDSAVGNHDQEPGEVHRALVERLGDGDFSQREEATEKIWSLGTVMLPHLKDARDSGDPELAARASMLIQNIEAGILPTTDQAVIQAIEDYNNANAYRGKLDALHALIQKKAHKQALYLLGNEEDAEHRSKLAQERGVRQAALAAAHNEVAEGKVDEAISILRLAPFEGFNLRALAHLLKHSGKIESELKRLSSTKLTQRDRLWKLVLLQTKGDLKQLKNYAQEQRLEKVLSVLAMVDGNPHLVLNELISRSAQEVHTNALKTLKTIYQQNKTLPAKEFTQSLQEEADETAMLYQSALAMLMGQREVGEFLLERASEPLASEYYQSLESSAQELALIGNPDPIKEAAQFDLWLAKQIALELDLDQNHLDQESPSKALTLGKFYYQRGELDVAERIYGEYLAAVKQHDNELWYRTVADMSQFGMSALMLKFINKRELNEEGQLIMIGHLFGNTNDVDKLWELVSESTPNKNERFDKLCQLMAMPHSTESGRKLEREILLTSKTKEAAERVVILEALGYAAEHRGDYVNMLEYYKRLSTVNSENSVFLVKYRQAAELQMAWGDIIQSYDIHPAYYQRNPVNLTRYAIAHAKQGDDEKFKSIMERATVLSLGLSKTVNSMAMVLHECGFSEEAFELWMQNLISFNSSDWEFYMALNYINNVSHYLISNGKWKQASALAIVESAIYMEPSAHPLSSSVRPLRLGFSANFTYGMALLEAGKKKQAIDFLTYAHDSLLGDGVLANHFFPSVLNTDLRKEREYWFQASWEKLESEIEQYPNAHNTRNTIAWLGSRAVSRLEDSKQHSEIALQIQPNQPAYLDTLAEVYFAMGDRKTAVKISNKALNAAIANGAEYRRNSNLHRQHEAISMMYWDLTHQHKRFEKSALPASLIK